MKEYLCDAQIMGKGSTRDIVVWLSSPSQAEAKKAVQALFPNDRVASVTNVRLKKYPGEGSARCAVSRDRRDWPDRIARAIAVAGAR